MLCTGGAREFISHYFICVPSSEFVQVLNFFFAIKEKTIINSPDLTSRERADFFLFKSFIRMVKVQF